MPAEPKTPSIFLNYRKLGGIEIATALRLGLEERLGKGMVFQDNFTIKPGDDWEKKIPHGIKEAQVFLALIHGDEWFSKTEQINKYKSRPLLFREDDWVRREIRLALREGKFIIPILLPNVSLWPRNDNEIADAAPADLAPFFKKQYETFDPDKVDRCLEDLFSLLKPHVPVAVPAPGEKPRPAPPREPDPLAGLPLDPALVDGLCHIDAPYVGLNYFDKVRAPLFFGRESDILELYQNRVLPLKRRQVLLFYGASGVGKSSMLHAGLFPRLEYQGWYVGYRRRDKTAGLDADLEALKQEALKSNASAKLLLLDQVEEMFTDPGRDDEAAAFFNALNEVLTNFPQLKLVLSFRKEYLAEVKDHLKDRDINFLWYSLRSLDEKGIRKAIHGVFEKPELKAQFAGLESLAPALEEALVNDITKDEASNIAPLLQYQLRTIWDEAKKRGNPVRFTADLYQGETSLKDFLEKHKLKAVETRFPDAARSGLINDILYFYTTPDRTAASRSQFRYVKRYRHVVQQNRKLLSEIQQCLIDEYLLICDGEKRTSRLAHDSLARIVHERYLKSSAPGQQAAKIVNAKATATGREYAVDFSMKDIEIIEAGKMGMPALSQRMLEKIESDRKRYERQREERLELALSKARSDIEHLRFEEALKNLQIASLEQIGRERILELARQLLFPLAELERTAELNETQELLADLQPEEKEKFPRATNAVRDRPGLHQWLKKQDADFHQAMWERHFPAMCRVEGGSFQMGSREGHSDEKPVHPVSVSTFQMGATPVTFWQYGLFCLATGREMPRDSGFGRGDKPVINVDWHDAIHYCNWLSERMGYEPVYAIERRSVSPDWSKNGFRLPTEAEWEFAARERGKSVRFGNGQDIARPAEINFDAGHQFNSQDWVEKGLFRQETTSVKTFRPNALGLYDMSGNVWEWCWDWYAPYNLGDILLSRLKAFFGRKSASLMANYDPAGPESGSSRVVRGGSWLETADACRCSYRLRYHPMVRDNDVGFRVVRRPGNP